MSVRLIEPRPAPAKIKQFLDEELQLPLGAQAHVSQIARCTPFEACAKGDVVLLKVEEHHRGVANLVPCTCAACIYEPDVFVAAGALEC